MKKTYHKPVLSTYCVPAYCGDVATINNVSGGALEGSEDFLSKEREFEEDNEAFNVTDGEGMATYGDLW